MLDYEKDNKLHIIFKFQSNYHQDSLKDPSEIIITSKLIIIAIIIKTNFILTLEIKMY